MCFRYSPTSPWLLKDLNFAIDMHSRVAIVGPNGVGKSTLLALMMGDLEPCHGEIVRGRALRAGKYAQHFVDALPMDKSPVEFLGTMPGDVSYQELRNLLGSFGLEGRCHTVPIGDLSGGQKARVLLASLRLQNPHVLFLDEPTNHLDMESVSFFSQVKHFSCVLV